MTTERPVLPGGTIVPGLVDPQTTFSYLTKSRHGRAVKEEVPRVSAPVQPVSLGNERHKETMGALKDIAAKITQAVTQKTTEAMEEKRLWRG